MEIIKTLNENNQFVVEIKCSGEQWDKAFKKEYDNAAKSVRIEGFRPGKVPAEIVKKYINEKEVAFRAIFRMDENALDIVKTNPEFVKVQDELFPRPALDVVSLEKMTATIKLVYSYLPKLTNDYDYKKIKLYETKSEKITDEEINEEIAKYQAQSTKVIDSTATKLAKGQIAVFDFTGFLDGVEFDGGKAKNFELEIGSNQFIPGFEDQMVDMEVGSEKDINVVFPEEYHEKSLAGKPVVFKIKLHSIKEKVTPELNDETIKEMNIPGIETLAELKDYVKNYLLEKVKASNKELVLKSAAKDFIEKGELTEIAEEIIQDELDTYIQEISQYYKQQGMSLDQILKLSNTKIDDFKQMQVPEIIKKIKLDALVAYVAKKENLNVTDADFNAEVEKLSKLYGVDAEIINQRLSSNKKRIMKELLLEKILDKLFELNKNNEKLPVDEHNHDYECTCGHEH